MFGRKKKKNQPTFKQGVSEFWDWYQQVGPRFYETIERGECESLTEETLQFMNTHLPTMSWVFGPGEDGGHSFTVTGEGVVPKQLLAQYWCDQAVAIPGWTFYASRQASKGEDLQSMAIAVGEQEQVDSDTFAIKTTVDDEQKLIHIQAWHPALENVPQEHHFQILFLLLDEALGEFGTQMWLGEVKLGPIDDGEETRSLTDLPAFIEQVNQYHKWEKMPPPKTYSLYRFNEQRDGPRGDTVVGTSIIPNVVGNYIHHQGKLPEDPLEGTGASLAYIAIDGAIFPDGKQSEVRGNIEDALEEALDKQSSGRVLGGAFGVNEAYIDVLIVDGENTRQIIEKQLHDLQLDGRSRIESFA
ncbi:MAG: hypothetical protein HKN47_23475 [Pirellulaceae bacterium]|nr:hypothetical protein [Pirellulaceae bacterium]